MSFILKFLLVLIVLYYLAKFALRLMFAPFIRMQKQMMEDVRRQSQNGGFYGPQNGANQAADTPEGHITIKTIAEEKKSDFGSDDDEYIEYEEINGDT